MSEPTSRLPEYSMVCLGWRGFTIHIGIRSPDERFRGYQEMWWDGPIHQWGLGRFGQFNYLYSFNEAWAWRG